MKKMVKYFDCDNTSICKGKPTTLSKSVQIKNDDDNDITFAMDSSKYKFISELHVTHRSLTYKSEPMSHLPKLSN